MKAFTFGMKTMRITQNYNGTTSHKTHWYNSKDYADYPIDVAGKDGNREPYYATVDMQVLAIKGKGNSMTNTIWLVTTDKVQTPSGNMKVFMALTHWNDNDPYVSKLKVGNIVKAGEPICEEGVDGATANHLHVVYGNADRSCGSSLIQNSNGKWVSSGYCMKPEEIMYVDREFTAVVDTCGLAFQDKPKEENNNSFLGEKGWLGLGDESESVGKICQFMHDTFPKYGEWLGLDNEKILGNYYGNIIKSYITEFQKRTGLESDGNVGSITLAKLKEFGFKE